MLTFGQAKVRKNFFGTQKVTRKNNFMKEEKQEERKKIPPGENKKGGNKFPLFSLQRWNIKLPKLPGFNPGR